MMGSQKPGGLFLLLRLLLLLLGISTLIIAQPPDVTDPMSTMDITTDSTTMDIQTTQPTTTMDIRTTQTVKSTTMDIGTTSQTEPSTTEDVTTEGTPTAAMTTSDGTTTMAIGTTGRTEASTTKDITTGATTPTVITTTSSYDETTFTVEITTVESTTSAYWCLNAYNASEPDNDMDSLNDWCDDDDDNDGIIDELDNCQFDANPDQYDCDQDGMGDACDDDDDNDGILDVNDNCPLAPNADQVDIDGDGYGDVCKPLGELVQRVRIGKTYHGGFFGFINVPMTETTSDWRICLTFHRKVFNLEVPIVKMLDQHVNVYVNTMPASIDINNTINNIFKIIECKAKLVDFETNGRDHINFILGPGDDYTTLNEGDMLKIKFIATTATQVKVTSANFQAPYYLPMLTVSPQHSIERRDTAGINIIKQDQSVARFRGMFIS